jgi:hypothetical protein
MDRRSAQPIREGAIVVYEGQEYPVAAIVESGLWAPYFELAGVGLISHHLVDLPGERAGTRLADRRN